MELLPKGKKAKTPAQQAKRDENIRQAQERLQRLQGQQALEQQQREQAQALKDAYGYTGTPQQVVEQHNAAQRRQADLNWCSEVLHKTGNAGRIINHYHRHLNWTADPVNARQTIERFLRDPRNLDLQIEVDAHFEGKGKAQAQAA